MAEMGTSRAVRALQIELKDLNDRPVEGFRVRVLDDEDMFVWVVAIFGPPDTIYAGGYFRALMSFPKDYPYSPPKITFQTEMWHPNVYQNGDVCISILHPPVDDPQSGELASERWNPTQSVRTVLLSIISLLNEPNTSSPANVEASVMFRRWKESKGVDKQYELIVRRQVEATKAEARQDGVQVPMTLAEYCVTGAPAQPSRGESPTNDEDYYNYDDDDDMYDHYSEDDDDEDEEEEEEEQSD